MDAIMKMMEGLTTKIETVDSKVDAVTKRMDVLEAESPSPSPQITPENSAQGSQTQTATGGSTVQPVSLEDKRWRPEEIE